jgi:hypothetical protein
VAPANWMATQSRGHVKSRPSIDVQRLHILARCGMTATKCAKSNGWAHVAHEKALCGCAPAGPPPGDSGKCQTEGTARRWSAKGEQTFVDQCRRAALGRKRWLGMAADITKTLSLPSRRRFRKRKASVSENGRTGEAGETLNEISSMGAASGCPLLPFATLISPLGERFGGH